MQSTDTAVLAENRPDIQSDLSTLFEIAASLVAQLLDADLGGMAEVVDSGAALKMTIKPTEDFEEKDGRVVENLSLEASESLSESLSKSLSGRAFSKGDTVLVSDLAVDSRFSDEFLKQQGVVSALTVPLRLVNKPLGVLGVYRTQRREFTADNARFVEAIGQLLMSLVARFGAEEVLCQRRDEAGKKGLLHSAQIALADGADETPPPDSESELRSSRRHRYRHDQFISPMTDGTLPTMGDFFKVDCRDISGGGISFYLDSPPDFDTLVVAIGRRSAPAHFAARIAHVAKVEHTGRTQYLVGCQFTERVYL